MSYLCCCEPEAEGACPFVESEGLAVRVAISITPADTLRMNHLGVTDLL